MTNGEVMSANLKENLSAGGSRELIDLCGFAAF